MAMIMKRRTAHQSYDPSQAQFMGAAQAVVPGVLVDRAMTKMEA